MKKALKIVLIIMAVAFIAIQFYRPSRTNPPVVAAETLESQMQIPQNVHEILRRSCYDCHSNETSWIWYSNIAPLSWGIVDHVNSGRDEMNFSKWAAFSPEKKSRKLEEICQEIESREMPHYQYLWLHWDANMSEQEIKTVCEWSKNEAAKIP